MMFLLTLIQGFMSSMSSRSRNRSNLWYHGLCQIACHTSWLLVLVQVVSEPVTLQSGIAYVLGYTTGSLIGSYVSEKIEKRIGAVT